MKASQAASLIERLRSLAPAQRQVLERRLAEKGIDIGRLGILPRLGPRDVFPMAHTQERLWFLHQLEPESIAYHIWSFHELVGRLDRSALIAALREITRRHETLRTTFASQDGEPVQHIHADLPLCLPTIDLGSLPADQRAEEARRVRILQRAAPFDLERGPLMRLALVRCAPEDHTLIVAVHHIISDAWSIAIFQHELSTLYTTWQEDPEAPSPLPALPIQYGDFVHWQRTWQQPRVEDQQLAYWRQQLAGAPAVLQMPTDRPRPKVHRSRGASVQLTVPAQVTVYLKTLGRQEGATLFMAMLAAFKAILLRFSGQQDLCVGMPVAGRGREEIEDLLGFFVNTLVLRSDLSGNPNYRELLRRVQKVVIEAQDHQDLSFGKLVDALQPERSLTHTPLFQVSFAMLTTPAYAGTDTWNRFDTPRDSAFFDLDLELLERSSEELTGWLYYNTSLFDATTMIRLRNHWIYLFAGLIEEPERGIQDHNLLAPTERWQLVGEWNDTYPSQDSGHTLHTHFETRAAAHPDTAALTLATAHLTYGELDRRANRLAHRLCELGVQPEMRVGLCLQRSIDLIVGILGILKAGGVYVPLDPNYPQQRLAWLVEDARMRWVVTHRDASRQLGKVASQVICLDTEADAMAQQQSTSPRRDLHPDNAAYVIYTSGSTGRPKGVVISHRNVLRLFEVTVQRFGFDQRDIWSLFHSYAFDFSVWELWGALLYGGRLVVVPFFVTRSPDDFYHLLCEQRISVLNQTPSAFRQLMHAAETAGSKPANLRRIIFGGEALEARQLTSWLEHSAASALQLVNMYGITETTVHVTYHHLTLTDTDVALRSPIGRALPDLTCYLLDPGALPTAIGSAGELHVGGTGLARGYSRRPALSAERFVPNPFGRQPGERLYRSGDQARCLPDGQFDFLGRVDHQVKIRGFRIELGEIEGQLLEHPAVRETVTVARQDTASGSTHQRLVAYCVPTSGQLPAADELRTFLLGRLPEFMVPARFVPLDEIPLTAHGKVDRAALADIALARSQASGRHAVEVSAAPETETEKQLAAVWCSVLRLDHVGRFDNFFGLGGDSILSIQIVARANQLGLRLTPRQFFQYQTLADLAAVAEAGAMTTADQGPVTGSLVLTPAQQWFFEQQPAEPHHYNQAVLLRLKVDHGPAILRQTVAHLVAHHDALRLRFEPGPSGWHQRSSEFRPSDADAFGVIDLARIEVSETSRQIETAAADLQRSLELSQGPIFRVIQFTLCQPHDDRLLSLAHHLAIDGVSWRILLNDLEAVAHHLARHKTPRLPPKTTSFQQWGTSLAERSRSGALDDEKAYWLDPRRTHAATLPPDAARTTHTSTNTKPTTNTVSSARTVRVTLGKDATHALLRHVPQVYRTRIHEVLMAALLDACTEDQPSGRLLVEVEGHGREEELVPDADLSSTVGWFTTFYPVLLERPAEPGPAELLKHVKETVRGVPRHGIGYGLLRYLSDDSTTIQHLQDGPQPAISFNYLGQLDQALPETSLFAPAPESPGPTISPRQKRRYAVDINCSIFDDQLSAEWTYSSRLHRRSTVERWANRFVAALEALIQHCASPEAGGYTPSDFPLADLNPADLDRLLRRDAAPEDIFPLSSTQQGMLFFSLYDPTSQAYLVQNTRRLTGELDVDALRQAFDQLIGQHQSLRASFAWDGLDQPLQIVHANIETPWTELDWRTHNEQDQVSRLERFLAEDRKQGFDLTQAPLLRLALIRLADTHYFLSWSCHHILMDGWSGPLLHNELLDRYGALGAGHDPQLAAPRPFRDYILWLQQQDQAQAETFWRRQLAGFRQPTSIGLLPATTGVRQTKEQFGTRAWATSPEVFTQIEALRRQHQLTLNTIAQVTWALLLSRFSNQEDVLFGATVSGRSIPLAGIDTMIGLFINTLPVRAQIAPETSFAEWTQQLQDEQVAAREYEHTPLMNIQKWSEVPATRLLFESIVVFENYPTEHTSAPGPGADAEGQLNASVAHAFERTSFPLTLIVSPIDPSWYVQLSFDLRYLEETTADRIVATFETLLAGFAARPNAALWELPLLSDSEREQLLVELNTTAVDTATQGTIPQLFARQAAATPEAMAVISGSQGLSYRQLAQQADRLARQLRSRGVGPEDRVALYMERRIELIVALLGVLQAGAAYVPLDPKTPQQRLARLLSDAGVGWTLSDPHLRSNLPPSSPVLCMDEAGLKAPSLEATLNEPRGTEVRGVEVWGVEVWGDHLAYLIYTSGSTGQPKAVMIEHRSLADYSLAAAASAELNTADRVLQFASISFDTAAEEIYPCLIRGGTLVLRDNDMLDFSRFLDACRQHRLSVLDLPTAYWHELTHYLEREERVLPPSVRLVIIGGEAADPEVVAAWHRQVDDTTLLVNTYGPTEATIVATQHPLVSPPVPRQIASGPYWPPITIGRPRANSRVYVLDRFLQPMAPQIAGVLYLAGIGLARGYDHQPAPTAASFLPDPFSTSHGERLYRTGDRVKQHVDGTLEFLGRSDQQIKLRGFRVELGEIESTLVAHPAVQVAAVVLQEGGRRRLVAGFVTTQEPAPSSQQLTTFLRSRLPDYMVPATFVELPELPHTPSGKIDRRALINLAETPNGEAEIRGASHDPLERQLISLWESLFDYRPIGSEDDFFELGGDSLVALRLLSLLRHELGHSVPLAALFEHRTPAELANLLRQNSPESDYGSPLVTIQPAGSKPPLFMVHPGGGNVLCYSDLGHRLAPDQPLFGLQAEQVPHAEPLSVQERAQHYLAAVRLAYPDGPYALAGWSLGGVVAWEMARQLRNDGHDIAMLALIDTLTPAQLPEWPGDDLAFAFAESLGLWQVESPAELAVSLSNLSLDQKLDHLQRQAIRAGLLPSASSRQAIHRLWRVFESVVRSVQHHEPGPYAEPVLLVRAGDEPTRSTGGEDYGWKRYASGGLDITWSPGGHHNIVMEPHVQPLAQTLRRYLTQQTSPAD